MEDVREWFARLDDCTARNAIKDLSALTYQVIRKIIEEREKAASYSSFQSSELLSALLPMAEYHDTELQHLYLKSGFDDNAWINCFECEAKYFRQAAELVKKLGGR